ncbi:hypothetical protein FRC01_005662, partial [Tulasnella sp. 417]
SQTYLDESRSDKGKVQCWGDRPKQGNQRVSRLSSQPTSNPPPDTLEGFQWVVKKVQGKDAYVIHNFEFSRYLHVAEREQGSLLTATDDQPAQFIFKKEGDAISIHLTNSNLCLDLNNGLKNDGELETYEGRPRIQAILLITSLLESSSIDYLYAFNLAPFIVQQSYFHLPSVTVMFAANLTPEQQKVLSLIQMFENTGGSAGCLKHLEEVQAGTRSAPHTDANEKAVDEFDAEIKITADQPVKDHFTMELYIVTGYGYAPGVTTIAFSGCLRLKAGISWKQITEAGMLPVTPVDGVDYSWEVKMAGEPLMWFQMCLKGEGALRIPNMAGMMFWRKVLPYPGE